MFQRELRNMLTFKLFLSEQVLTGGIQHIEHPADLVFDGNVQA